MEDALLSIGWGRAKVPPGPPFWLAPWHLAQFGSAPILFLNAMQAKYGDLVRLRIGPRLFYLCYHPDSVRHIFKDRSENYRKSRYVFQQMEPLIGKNALVSQEGSRWEKNRRMTNQFFQSSRFPEFFEHVHASLEGAFEALDRAAETGNRIDLTPLITAMVLRAAGLILFSMDFKELAGSMVTEFLAMNELCGRGIRSGGVRIGNIRRHFSKLESMIAEVTVGAPQPKTQEENILAFFRGTTEPGADEKRTLQQMIAFLFPAFETTSTSILWALSALSHRMGVQERVAIEVREGYDGTPSGLDRLPHWKLLEANYKESLRLNPPAWILAREAIENDVIGDFSLKKGATILVSLRDLHRHPNFWREPDLYRPERFFGEEDAKRDPFAFIPFGAGPRICSGTNLGMAESMMILGRLLQRYQFRACDVQESAMHEMITGRPGTPLWVRIVRQPRESCPELPPKPFVPGD